MSTRKLQIFSLACALVGIAILQILGQTGKVSADANAGVNWAAGPATIANVAQLDSPPLITNQDCTNTTLQVARGLLQAPYEQHCVVPTAMGLMDRNGDMLQPAGYAKAYPVSVTLGNHPSMVPLPNQAAAVYVAPYSGTGTLMGVYQDMSTHLQFKQLDQKYVLSDGPETVFRYADSNYMQFNPATLAASPNGTYIIADTIFNGFVRINTQTFAMQPFANSLMMGSGNSLLNASTAIDGTGQFAAIAYNAPGGWGDQYFKIVDVASCSGSLNANSHVQPKFSCHTADFYPQVKQAIPGLAGIYNVRFVNDRTVTFVARYTVAGVDKYASYRMTAAGQPASLVQYLALGDSYTSGEGAFDYREGTDTTRNQCHQSLVSYPYLLSASFNSFGDVACSGARMNNVTGSGKPSDVDQLEPDDPSGEESVNALAGYLPGVIAQRKFVDATNPQAVTISIGGNDVGFGDILAKCVDPTDNLSGNLASDGTCYDTYEDRAELVNTINSKFPQLRDLYASLRDASAANRRVYVVGYPQVAKVGGDCAVNVNMNADEISFAHDLIAYLDSVIEQAANQAGVVYVNTQDVFDAHRLCEGPSSQSAMNGFTISKSPTDGSYNYKASFHPNQLGHRLLAAAVGAATANLTEPMPAPAPHANAIQLDPNIPLLQHVPHTNRAIRYVESATNITSWLVSRAALKVGVDGHEFLLRAASAYNIVINSTPVNLGTFQTDANGNLNVSTPLPANLPVGFHTVHIYGDDIFGNPVDIQQVVYVTASPDDYDGDGIPNSTDSCVLLPQSGIDADQDGIDDACDPLISDLPAPVPTPANPDPSSGTIGQTGPSNDQENTDSAPIADPSEQDEPLFSPQSAVGENATTGAAAILASIQVSTAQNLQAAASNTAPHPAGSPDLSQESGLVLSDQAIASPQSISATSRTQTAPRTIAAVKQTRVRAPLWIIAASIIPLLFLAVRFLRHRHQISSK